jgi:hypothetical protein
MPSRKRIARVSICLLNEIPFDDRWHAIRTSEKTVKQTCGA